MKRTTILVDEGLLVEARHLASLQGKTFTVFVQEALREYIAARRKPRRISFAGMGRSGRALNHEKIDEVLRAGLDPVEGWSPPRRTDRESGMSPGDTDGRTGANSG